MQSKREDPSALLGTLPIRKLVPRVSVPIMVSMLVQALYNVVDSIFVSRYDPDALTAVSLAYPIQMLMIALSVGMGVGINSLISRKLGAGHREEARVAAWNGVVIELCGTVLFMLVGALFAGTFLNALTCSSLNNAVKIRSLGTTYLSIVTIFSQGLFMSVLLERMLQSTGNTVLSMITQMSGALVNIILDPIMIYGLLGFPELGVAGAAVATVTGQWAAMGVGFALNQKKNPELRLKLKEFRYDTSVIKAILAVGLPSTVMQAISSVMTIGMNTILSSFPQQGNDAVNVLNIYFKLQSFVFMPVFGLGSGMVAIIGYNFGAGLKKRVYESIRVALKLALTILAVGMVIFLVFPGQLMSVFEGKEAAASSSMQAIGVTAMRTICLHFIFAAVGITLSNVFQAVGRGMYSMIISLCRQLLVLLPAAWLLSKVSLIAVWWSFLIAEFVSMTLSVVFYRQCDRTMISALPDGTGAGEKMGNELNKV
ncbi:MAG: MATE family efflux transporter [Clostridia bacterium]|nr:MATE family efflux transporter [Clostridia bacterium]